MVFSIKLYFGGGLGVVVIGLFFMAGAAYLDSYYAEPGRFATLFAVGEVAIMIGLVFASISYYYWAKYTNEEIARMI